MIFVVQGKGLIGLNFYNLSQILMNTINPDSLFTNLHLADKTSLEQWDPPYCGEIDITIHSDGRWSYLGSTIQRKSLIQLFASVLRKENQDYFLVTPVEKVKLTVESEPFITTSFEYQSKPFGAFAFKTNLDDIVVAGAEHPITVSVKSNGEPHPTILVRNNLNALISRSDYYQLVDVASFEQKSGVCSINSNGITFVLGNF